VKVVNQSHRLMSEILPLVEFVAARMQYADMAYLHLRSGIAYAMATKNNDNPAGTTPSRVDISMPRLRLYPRDDQYPEAGVGVVVLNDWREEFILTLAHELRHIDQFWWTRKLPANIEHDAETFGVQVLNDWRRANRRPVLYPFQIEAVKVLVSKPKRGLSAARRSR
jgi:hypothetical protein